MNICVFKLVVRHENGPHKITKTYLGHCFLFQIDEPSEVKKTIENLTKGVSDMVSMLQRINAPNMKAMEK